MGPWLRRRGRPRTSGTPPSANGVSSLHLRWDVDGDLRSVSVDLTVEVAPSVPRLYFWALQADFATALGHPAGGAHLGLQWHPAHPDGRAVNWGGYRWDGSELDGSSSALPSATANPNTRDFAWQPNRAYRLTIARTETTTRPSGPTAWRATVTDLTVDATTVVRDLFVPGDRIRGALVWSEVFARCARSPAKPVCTNEPTPPAPWDRARCCPAHAEVSAGRAEQGR